MGFFSPHPHPRGPACGQPSCPSLARVTVGDSVTASSQHQACGWSDHEVQRHGRDVDEHGERRRDEEGDLETGRQKRYPERCQTEAGGRRGRESVGGKTKLEEVSGGKGGRGEKMGQREGRRKKRERKPRKQGGDWVRKVEKTDTEARVGPKHGNLEN